MKVKGITDIFFDLDHTLWDFERNSALAFASVLEAFDIDVPLADFLTHYVPLNRWYWEQYRKELVTQAELRYGRLKETFDRLDYAISDALLYEMSEAYIQNLPLNNHLYDGALELLEFLQPHYKLHIITNGFQAVQDKKIKNSGIAPYFQTITNSETAGVKKPHPKIFQVALAAAQCTPQQAVMIGDCLEADIQGALDVGMQAIFFNEFKVVIPNDIKQIKQLVELKTIFKYE
ncbi:MAG: YjjG family noncanonical pyrimidine nucleotidase [Flavobacterium sp.]|nr:YjjG family noncanonical pyrimidine nucleotidase [Flavobacterium sp.]MCZ8169327.1 YjjG family noncanonical pyrimidine nucleotidase [Flavobacterium sp.]MCZ8296067.1 YjjG family noncanonical pyrimidine nucleotidase [Flavobacterium sp.]